MTDLPTLLAELEEAERHWKDAKALADETKDPLDMMAARDAFNARDALMRTHLPTLIEAVKRQGEALNHIVSIGEGHGSNYDFERILDMRDAARAALKENTDV